MTFPYWFDLYESRLVQAVSYDNTLQSNDQQGQARRDHITTASKIPLFRGNFQLLVDSLLFIHLNSVWATSKVFLS